MCNRIPRSKFFAVVAAVLLLHPWIAATAEIIRFTLVPREGVEARLSQDGKTLLLDLKGHGTVTFADAVKRGLVTVRRQAK